MKRAYNYLFVLLSAFLLSACGNDKTTFSLLADSDSFQQDEASKLAITKIDILWVIDNSGSMQTSQNQLAENFDTFINDFSTKGLDFQIAIIGTDAYKTAYNGNEFYVRFRDAGNNHKILYPTTPNLIDIFKDNIKLGIYGSGDERAFQSMRDALNFAPNNGLLREDSYLAVIIVSDEDDFSHPDSFGIYDNTDPDLDPVTDYLDYLDTLTNSTADYRRYSVSAMAIWDEACKDSLNTEFKGRIIGTRYAQLVDATNGTKGSLCGNFAEELEFMSQKILTAATSFPLSRIPIPETIVVIVDGNTIPKTSETTNGDGWRYNADTNSIEFVGQYVPAQGAIIDISYDPVAYGQ